MSTSFNVVIVGGGFSGTMLALALFRREPSLTIAVIERHHRPGCGVAYSTDSRFHLLNIPAVAMSPFLEEPEHPLRWARLNYSESVQPRSFLPRSLYGRYISELLHHALESTESKIEWFDDEVLSLRFQNGIPLAECRSARQLKADVVVLATGNFPPADPNVFGVNESTKRYFPFAWSQSAFENLPSRTGVLLIGSGLTSVDLALALKSKGFRGTIILCQGTEFYLTATRRRSPGLSSGESTCPKRHAVYSAWFVTKYRQPQAAVSIGAP